MANLIVLEEREVKPKGLNPQNKVDEEKLRGYFFDEDYEKLKLLQEVPRFDHSFEQTTLFYPGCGADIFYPLHYLELFPKLKEINFILVDENDSFGLIKTQLDEVGISFEEERKNKNKIKFYWEDKLVNLEFIKEYIKKAFPKIPQYHIYFEKAFRIMREHIPYYEQSVFDKLASGGVIISDSGFEEVEMERISVPLELSSYGEMVMGRKK
ncbi:MAG: hypothetical protein AABX04_07095 [Nanoarchaeota archaeon]